MIKKIALAALITTGLFADNFTQPSALPEAGTPMTTQTAQEAPKAKSTVKHKSANKANKNKKIAKKQGKTKHAKAKSSHKHSKKNYQQQTRQSIIHS